MQQSFSSGSCSKQATGVDPLSTIRGEGAVISAHAISLTSHETPGDYRRIRLLAFFSRKATSKDGNCPL
jgi:hypothetical protein